MTDNTYPIPAGYRILIRPEDPAEKTEGGIFLTQETQDVQRFGGVIAKVLAMGPLAYMDPDKFPTGPWCKVGDTIMIAKHAGYRFEINKEPYKIINDDEVIGLVPEGLKVNKL